MKPPLIAWGRVIQRMQACTDPFCKTPNCAGNHPPVSGARTYTQATDPSVKPFLKTTEKRMGEEAFRKQVGKKSKKGTTISATDVRVPAVKEPHARMGNGQHEMYPTNKASSAVGVPFLASYQSGARTSTGKTLFNQGGDVAAHTGMFPNDKLTGSTGTRGQAPAHDQLRNFAPPPNLSAEQKNVARLGHGVSLLATGPQVMNSANITGSTPNRKGAAKIKPPNPPNTDPERVLEARRAQQTREHLKQRTKTVALSRGMQTPTSPWREPLDAQGQGGGYGQGASPPRSPLPSFPAQDPYEKEADVMGWATAPGRFHVDSATRKECAACGIYNLNYLLVCEACGAPL